MKNIELYVNGDLASFSIKSLYSNDAPVTIKLSNYKSTKNIMHIKVNNKIIAFDKKGEVTLERYELKSTNTCELQERESDGTIIKRWNLGKLYYTDVKN